MPGNVEELETLLVKVVTDAVKFTEGMAAVERQVTSFVNKNSQITVKLKVDTSGVVTALDQAVQKAQATVPAFAAWGETAGRAYSTGFQRGGGAGMTGFFADKAAQAARDAAGTGFRAQRFATEAERNLMRGMEALATERKAAAMAFGGVGRNVPQALLPYYPRIYQGVSIPQPPYGLATPIYPIGPYLGPTPSAHQAPAGMFPGLFMRGGVGPFARLEVGARAAPGNLFAWLENQLGRIPEIPRPRPGQGMLGFLGETSGAILRGTGGYSGGLGGLFRDVGRLDRLGAGLGVGFGGAARGLGSLATVPVLPSMGHLPAYGLLGNLFLSRMLFRSVAGAAKPGFEFEDVLNKSMIGMGVVGKPGVRDQLAGTAIGISTSSITGATELARVYRILAQAGLGVVESQTALVEAEKLTVATGGDLTATTTRLMAAQTAMGMRTGDVAQDQANLGRIANVLARASQLAGTSADQLAEGLERRAAAAARQLGIDLEGLTSILVIYARQGYEGTTAANLMTTGLTQLQKASIGHKDAWSKMGVSIFDAKGKFLGMEAVIGGLEKRFAGMSPEMRRTALGILGLSDMGVIAIDSLIGFSKQLGDVHDDLENVDGVLNKMYKQTLGSTVSQLKMLGNQFEAIGIQIALYLAPYVTMIIDKVKEAIEWWNSWDKASREIAMGFGLTVVALSLGAAVLTTGFLAVSTVMGVIAGIIGMFFSPLALMLVAATAAAFMLAYAIWGPDSMGEAWVNAEGAMKDFFKDTKGFLYNFRENFQIITDWLVDNWAAAMEDMRRLTAKSLENIWENYKTDAAARAAGSRAKTLKVLNPFEWFGGSEETMERELSAAYQEAYAAEVEKRGGFKSVMEGFERTTPKMKDFNFKLPPDEKILGQATDMLSLLGGGTALGVLGAAGGIQAMENQRNLDKMAKIPGTSQAVAALGLAAAGMGPLGALGITARGVGPPPPEPLGLPDMGKGRNVFEEINLRRFALEGPGGLAEGRKEMKDDIKSIAHSSGKTEEHLAKILERGGFGVVGRGAGRR